jgi:hypothetical protein
MMKKYLRVLGIAGLAILISYPVQASEADKEHRHACGNHPKAQKLAKLIMHDPLQQRSELYCSELLSEIAEGKAKEMSKKGRVRHAMPNRRLIEAGYPLSKIYPRALENNVEAVAGGMKYAEKVWQIFKSSDDHRMHLLAEHEFYRLQNEIGVGYYKNPNSPHVEYWAVYMAHREEKKVYQGEIAKSKN